jgi:hypothetical protein
MASKLKLGGGYRRRSGFGVIKPAIARKNILPKKVVAKPIASKVVVNPPTPRHDARSVARRIVRNSALGAGLKKVPVVTKKSFYRFPKLAIFTSRISDGARALAKAVGCRKIRGTPFIRPGDTIINWGDTSAPGTSLNPPNAIRLAVNKLETLKVWTEAKVPILKWTQDKEEVKKWLKKGNSVFARKVLTGASGAGIAIISPLSATVESAPLYTRNYPKTHEFRVHVFDGKVIDLTEKKAKLNEAGTPAVADRLVRSHDNGWVFAHGAISLDAAGRKAVEDAAILAVQSLGLLFGGVDILAILTPGGGDQRALKSLACCEVNTAPGLENTATIEAYRKAITDFYTKKAS